MMGHPHSKTWAALHASERAARFEFRLAMGAIGAEIAIGLFIVWYFT